MEDDWHCWLFQLELSLRTGQYNGPNLASSKRELRLLARARRPPLMFSAASSTSHYDRMKSPLDPLIFVMIGIATSVTLAVTILSFCFTHCRFRRSTQAVSVIDSMSHAVVRAYLELNQAKRLMPLLTDRVRLTDTLHRFLERGCWIEGRKQR